MYGWQGCKSVGRAVTRPGQLFSQTLWGRPQCYHLWLSKIARTTWSPSPWVRELLPLPWQPVHLQSAVFSWDYRCSSWISLLWCSASLWPNWVKSVGRTCCKHCYSSDCNPGTVHILHRVSQGIEDAAAIPGWTSAWQFCCQSSSLPT